MYLELTQEAQIATLHQPDVVDSIAHHGEPRQAESKCKTVPLFRVDAAHPQHVRMHQTAGKQFHPAALFAYGTARSAADKALNVEFESGFDKREISRPQADGYVTLENGAEQRLHEVDEVRDGHIAVDHHAFELIKRMLMRGVHFFIPKDAARRDHAQRRT